jgi:hypothetical protein
MMKDTVATMKRKLMDFLQNNKIWMKGGDIESVKNSGFDWFFAAHDAIVFRPALQIVLVDLIKALPINWMFENRKSLICRR